MSIRMPLPYTLSTTFHIIETSEVFAQFLGHERSTMLGKPIFEFIEPVALQHTLFTADVLAYTGYIQDIPLRYVHREGHLVCAMLTVAARFHDDASISSYRATIIPMSHQEYAQHLQSFTQGIFTMGIHPDEVGVLIIDENRRVTGMNPYAQELTGWTLERAKGKLAKQVYTTIYETTQLNCPPPGLIAMSIGGPTQTQNDIILTDRRGVPHLIKHSGDLARNSEGTIVGGIQFFVRDGALKSKSFTMNDEQYHQL